MKSRLSKDHEYFIEYKEIQIQHLFVCTTFVQDCNRTSSQCSWDITISGYSIELEYSFLVSFSSLFQIYIFALHFQLHLPSSICWTKSKLILHILDQLYILLYNRRFLAMWPSKVLRQLVIITDKNAQTQISSEK